jgi:hypothetical protein
VFRVAKGAEGESLKKLIKARDLTKNRHSESLKKSQLTLYQGKMKMGDDVVVN